MPVNATVTRDGSDVDLGELEDYLMTIPFYSVPGRTDAHALELHASRPQGRGADDAADDALLALFFGEGAGEVTETTATLTLTDPGTRKPLATLTLDRAVVGEHAEADAGAAVGAGFVMRAAKVHYQPAGGDSAVILDVLAPHPGR